MTKPSPPTVPPIAAPWVNEKVDVLWHEDVGEKAECVFFAGYMNGVSEPLACAIVDKEGLATKAGERKVMGIEGDIEALAVLAMWRLGGVVYHCVHYKGATQMCHGFGKVPQVCRGKPVAPATAHKSA